MNNLPKSVYMLEGTRPGPTVLVLGGTHGDELVGIEVVKKMLALLGLSDACPIRRAEEIVGRLYLGFGNPAAIAVNRRAAADGRDLNRSFVESELAAPPMPEDRPDLVRARELAPLLASVDYLFDIHSTSSASPPFICLDAEEDESLRLCGFVPVQRILTDPDALLAVDDGLPSPSTTDSYVCAHGGRAFAYETGLETDVSRTEAVLADALRLLDAVGVRKDGSSAGYLPARQEIFAMTHNVSAQAAPFRFAPGMEQGWREVCAGDLVGRYADGREERIPADGLIIFSKAEHKISPGKSLYYMARRKG